jgi:hypothetical protein
VQHAILLKPPHSISSYHVMPTAAASSKLGMGTPISASSHVLEVEASRATLASIDVSATSCWLNGTVREPAV